MIVRLAWLVNLATMSDMKDSLNLAIKTAGGVAALAAAINAPSIHAVRWWRTARVPAEYCPAIEAATGVRCEELRPDVQWGVLRGTAQAPEQVAKEAA